MANGFWHNYYIDDIIIDGRKDVQTQTRKHTESNMTIIRGEKSAWRIRRKTPRVERERERERDRETERQRDRDREKQREKEKGRERQTDTHRHTEKRKLQPCP